MKIEQIIYDTTREVTNVEDKMRIATPFLFCYKLGCESLANLLYSKDASDYIAGLNASYRSYGVDFTINFANPNIRNAFELTRKKVIEKWDDNGFYKGIFDGDPFAISICEILEVNYDAMLPRDIARVIGEQLSLFQ